MGVLQSYKFPSEDMKAALIEANGVIEDAAEIVGCSKTTILMRLYREPELAAHCTTVIDNRALWYDTDEVVRAIRSTRGNMSEAADIIGCTRGTLSTYVDRVEEVRAAYLEETERFKDLTITRLREAVDRGEPWAVGLAIRYFESVFRLYGPSSSTPQLGPGSGEVDLAILSDAQLTQLYDIAKLFAQDKAGVVEAEPN